MHAHAHERVHFTSSSWLQHRRVYVALVFIMTRFDNLTGSIVGAYSMYVSGFTGCWPYRTWCHFHHIAIILPKGSAVRLRCLRRISSRYVTLGRCARRSWVILRFIYTSGGGGLCFVSLLIWCIRSAFPLCVYDIPHYQLHEITLDELQRYEGRLLNVANML